MRGPQDHTRAEEYHGREAVKATTRAAQEEFTGELEGKAELSDADLRDPRSTSTASSACSTSSSASWMRLATATTP